MDGLAAVGAVRRGDRLRAEAVCGVGAPVSITQSDRERLAEDECTEEQIKALTAERDKLKAELAEMTSERNVHRTGYNAMFRDCTDARAERDALKAESDGLRGQMDAWAKTANRLEADNERLRADLALAKAGEAQALEAACEHRADNERLRAELAAIKEQSTFAGSLRSATQLTELREAVERLVNDYFSMRRWSVDRVHELAAVLAKLPLVVHGSLDVTAEQLAGGGKVFSYDLSKPMGKEIGLPTDPEERKRLVALLLEGDASSYELSVACDGAKRSIAGRMQVFQALSGVTDEEPDE